MLTITDFAAAAIHHQLERSDAPADAGLRIARTSPIRSLEVRLARAPEPGDTIVIAPNGARVFLDEAAASLLSETVLDVTIGVGGHVEFFTTKVRQPIEPGR